MITFQIRADIKDDRRIILTLPPEVPTGHANLVVTVESPTAEDAQVSGLADWAEVRAERNGSTPSRYPLRGSVVRYDLPTDAIAEGDWESLR
jgi:hypothetical protein